jgi:small subunit ribosomal protein S18
MAFQKNNRNSKASRDDAKFIANPAMQPQVFSKRIKKCPLSGEKAPVIDYKNLELLRQFISERGKILPKRITSVSSKKQRELANAIKRARAIALLPYMSN